MWRHRFPIRKLPQSTLHVDESKMQRAKSDAKRRKIHGYVRIYQMSFNPITLLYLSNALSEIETNQGKSDPKSQSSSADQ